MKAWTSLSAAVSADWLHLPVWVQLAVNERLVKKLTGTTWPFETESPSSPSSFSHCQAHLFQFVASYSAPLLFPCYRYLTYVTIFLWDVLLLFNKLTFSYKLYLLIASPAVWWTFLKQQVKLRLKTFHHVYTLLIYTAFTYSKPGGTRSGMKLNRNLELEVSLSWKALRSAGGRRALEGSLKLSVHRGSFSSLISILISCYNSL